MVVGSPGLFVTLADRTALQCGGNAVDAAITTALTQIVFAMRWADPLHPGSAQDQPICHCEVAVRSPCTSAAARCS